ncbi:hypothetical protein ACS0TY_017523 [Phlomoides rotata]
MQGGFTFSIREYASRMRSINVVNCWPFDEALDEETVKSLLPPITVKKFTWWLDELEHTHPESPQKSGKKRETSSKAKLKAPKKRSIVEIFAVAPPVERVTTDEEEEDDEFNEESSFEKDPSFKEKRKKMKRMKRLRVVKKIKKSQKVEIEMPNKLLQENSNKLKLHVQDKATRKSSSSHSKDLERNIHDRVPILKRKQILQHPDAYSNKPVPCEAFKLLEENKRPGFPVRGILKNNGDAFPLQQSMKCILQEAIQVNHCSTKMGNKHVTFSEMDETVVCDDASIRIEKEVSCGPARNEHLTTCIVDPTAFTQRNNEEEHSRIPETSERSLLHHGNQDWCAGGLRDTRHDPMDVCPRFFRMPAEGYYNSPNIKVIRNSSNSTYRRPRPVSPPRHFEEYMRTYNEPPVAHLFDMEKRRHTFSENAHSFQFQSLPHFPPKDFVGLPLNSQGELIRSNSNAKRDVNQTMNPSASAAHSINLSLPRNTVSSCYGHHSELGMHQLNLFPVESYSKVNPITVMPSRLGIVEPQSERNTNLDMDFLEVNHHSFHDSDIMCRGDEQLHRSHENQSTMRLMGKEFTVGGSGIQRSEDGHIWKDKQIIDQNEPSSGKFRETLFFPSDSKYALPEFDHRASPMYPSVFVARKHDPFQKIYPSLASGTFYNNKAFSEPFTSEFFTLELPTPTAAHQESYPYVIPTSMQLKNNQNLHQAPISAIRFPFLHPDLDERAISPWSRRSTKQRFDVQEKETLVSSSQSCSQGHSFPYLKPGTSHGTDSSERDDFRVFFPMPSVSASQTSVAPSSLPYHPGMLMQKCHGVEKKFKERTKSWIGKGSKSQLSALSTVPFKPLKMPTLGSHEYTQCAIRKPTAQASFDNGVDRIEDAFGSYPATNKSRLVMCGEYEADQDEGTLSHWMDSHIDTARTGPVKLSGGAKHILKAYKQKDQSSSTSIDQEISLSASNMDFRFLESENSAKIYRRTPVFDL